MRRLRPGAAGDASVRECGCLVADGPRLPIMRHRPAVAATAKLSGEYCHRAASRLVSLTDLWRGQRPSVRALCRGESAREVRVALLLGH